MKQFEPADFIALLLITGYLSLSFLGRSSELNSTILVIVGFYFGREHFKPKAVTDEEAEKIGGKIDNVEKNVQVF